jgi:hypothetical protein
MSQSQQSEEDSRSVSVSSHAGKLKLRNFPTRNTEPTTSDSCSTSSNNNHNSLDDYDVKVDSCSSADAPTIRSRNSNGSRPPINPNRKIGSAVARSRSGISALSRVNRKSLQQSRVTKKKKKLDSKAIVASKNRETVKDKTPQQDTNHTEQPIDHKPDDSLVQESAYRIKLGQDMMLIADALHLDNNTRTLLASFDAKTVEDFFMMGDVDFQELLARARNTNRGLPPLQVRKVRILREWVTDLIESTHPDASGLPWASSTTTPERKNKNVEEDSLLPRDWKRRFFKDLPSLKKKLRRKGDSISEIFPWLSFFLGFRDSFCGSRY